MKDYFYVASCVFTEEEPALSEKVQEYVQARFAMPVIRCCTPQYKVNEFEQRIPQSKLMVNYPSNWLMVLVTLCKQHRKCCPMVSK